ncbi:MULTISPECIES: AAA family ATPase [Haloarcula]|uniref:ATPase AAA n=1 Tax=Haloarcula pellucida TaxID=1427151 RepID=A0A830GIW4_9EURY|nr:MULTISPECIES: MoxR family ATPase [Halomicroarcula]MBX0348722.1 AAA family ATPase [Halomicroarcula pellucida]MDS0278490.1 AAA family ATPase [Halomicroarcula sp. S1AR25-4]GGN92070.1 ATPase AAA [Halomicroarcula pellucida]
MSTDTDAVADHCGTVLDTVSGAVITERETLETVLSGFLARGHVLLEDVPGTGKTLTARSLANALGLQFSRIQFTPDLLPADVTGTYVFNEKAHEFEFREGPIFGNVVLADEINRASPKTQAALLEAMAEGQVTIDGETHALPEPFFVIATQNPIEQDGTFPLPEAQVDRFVVKTSLGYPDEAGELEIIDRRAARTDRTPTVTEAVSMAPAELRQAPEAVHVEKEVRKYVVRLARATREEQRVETGVSPRATQRLFEAARALAVVRGRDYVTPDHVARIAPEVLSHRLVLTPDARVDDVEKRAVVADLLDEVEVPTVSYTEQPST